MAILIHPDARTELLLLDPQAAALEQLQAAVGGDIEALHLGPPHEASWIGPRGVMERGAAREVLVVNEHGRILAPPLPVNRLATALARERGLPLPEPLLGPAVFCVVRHPGAEDEEWI